MSTTTTAVRPRSEEHTSELQSLAYLVCRLLLEKKNTRQYTHQYSRHWRLGRSRARANTSRGSVGSSSRGSFSSRSRPPPRSTLFPYTTLFRSQRRLRSD